MSDELIARNPDLLQLRQDGYHICIKQGFLLLKNVPYLDGEGRVRWGTLVTALNWSGQKLAAPQKHTVFFQGDMPYTHQGKTLDSIRPADKPRQLTKSLHVDREFSNKPESGKFDSYHEKMTNYVQILEKYARSVDSKVSARTYQMGTTSEQSSPLVYPNAAVTREGITCVNERLSGHRIAIVGLGGTGSYVLDHVAKTPVAEIHLVDEDTFEAHNAFRAPGAAAQGTVEQMPRKVDYFRELYSRMHQAIYAHPKYLNAESARLLEELDFVFVCVDNARARAEIVGLLHARELPFIDVGMGLGLSEPADLSRAKVQGMVRATLSTPEQRGAQRYIPMNSASTQQELYESNIQISELNALNACMAVIKWKKYCGFYCDLENEYNNTYALNVSQLHNDPASEDAS